MNVTGCRIAGLVAVLLAMGGDLLPAEPTAAVLPPVRPLLKVTLRDGEQLEGMLERFDDGEYWILVEGRRKTFKEADAKSIVFSTRESDEVEAPKLAALIRQFLRVDANGRAADHADITLRAKLAARGPVVVRPLLAAYAKYQGDYQQTGLVLKELGPKAFPLLIEEFRQDGQGNYGHPVWYALRESGVHHAGYVQTLLDDEDARVRRLAMDTFYSWGSTSGVALPTTLAPALVKVLDDSDDDVRHQAPLILWRIGFRSKEVLPALLKTLTDDRYSSVRSNSVIALGHLAQDLKADDPDLATIVTALAAATTDDPSENIRSYAARYLGIIGPKAFAALPALERATDDKIESVRQAAEEAIVLVRAKEKG